MYSKHNSLQLAPVAKDLNKAIKYTNIQLYLGCAQPRYKRTPSGKLNSIQIYYLKKINIIPDETEYYHQGMVTAATKNLLPINLPEIMEYINEGISYVYTDDIYDDLINDILIYKKVEQAAIYTRDTSLIKAHAMYNLALADLGMFLVPKHLLDNIKAVQQFKNTVGRKIGYLIQLHYFDRIKNGK